MVKKTRSDGSCDNPNRYSETQQEWCSEEVKRHMVSHSNIFEDAAFKGVERGNEVHRKQMEIMNTRSKGNLVLLLVLAVIMFVLLACAHGDDIDAKYGLFVAAGVFVFGWAFVIHKYNVDKKKRK